MSGLWFLALPVLHLVYTTLRAVRLVPQQQAYIVERLGKYERTLAPGLHFLMPYIERVAYVRDLREESMEVPPQEAFTKDNVRVEVDGVIYISVVDAERACYGITDYRYAAVQLAQTTTRSVIGRLELDRTFEERDEINSRVVSVLSEVSDTWGIKVHRYEVKNIVPPSSVRDAMERQMSAERERRALIARAEGVKQSALNEAQGARAEAINISEGERQRRVNEAEGRAAEILSIAEATAESIRKIAYALTTPGGKDAMRLRLSERYISTLSTIGETHSKVLLPVDLSRVDELLNNLGLGRDGYLSGHDDVINVDRQKPAPFKASIASSNQDRVPDAFEPRETVAVRADRTKE